MKIISAVMPVLCFALTAPPVRAQGLEIAGFQSVSGRVVDAEIDQLPTDSLGWLDCRLAFTADHFDSDSGMYVYGDLGFLWRLDPAVISPEYSVDRLNGYGEWCRCSPELSLVEVVAFDKATGVGAARVKVPIGISDQFGESQIFPRIRAGSCTLSVVIDEDRGASVSEQGDIDGILGTASEQLVGLSAPIALFLNRASGRLDGATSTCQLDVSASSGVNEPVQVTLSVIPVGAASLSLSHVTLDAMSSVSVEVVAAEVGLFGVVATYTLGGASRTTRTEELWVGSSAEPVPVTSVEVEPYEGDRPTGENWARCKKAMVQLPQPNGWLKVFMGPCVRPSDCTIPTNCVGNAPGEAVTSGVEGQCYGLALSDCRYRYDRIFTIP